MYSGFISLKFSKNSRKSLLSSQTIQTLKVSQRELFRFSESSEDLRLKIQKTNKAINRAPIIPNIILFLFIFYISDNK